MLRYLLTILILLASPIYPKNDIYEPNELVEINAEEIEDLNRIHLADNVINIALKYLGVRYRYGHSTPKGFDCSGFTMYVFNKSDISLTRTSKSQYKEGEKVDRIEDLKKGDLVFFGGRRTIKTVGHVGIVTAVDSTEKMFEFVHACNRGVSIDKSTAPYYKRRYIGARRVIL